MVSERHGCNNGPLWAIRSAVTEAGLPSANRNLMAASFRIRLSIEQCFVGALSRRTSAVAEGSDVRQPAVAAVKMIRPPMRQWV